MTVKRNVPVEKGQSYILTIDGLGSSGEGVGRYDGFTVFVPFALPGEVVEVKITLVKKTYSTGEIVKVLTPSPHRITPLCEVYGECGGCQLQHVTYKEQLRLKTQKVRDVIERIAKCDPNLVLPAIGPENPWYYRNKMQMPVGGTLDSIKMGFYSRGTHTIVDGTECYIQNESNNKLAKLCTKLMKETSTEPYNELLGTGSVRHIIGRIGQEPMDREYIRCLGSNDETRDNTLNHEIGMDNEAIAQWMLIIVSATKKLKDEKRWVEQITKNFPQIQSIVLNYNPKNTNVIMGKENRVLWGQETIRDYIKNLEFQLSPHSFFQVNPAQTSVLYETALEYANLKGHETVIDAYCGTGTISLFLAQRAHKVIGIEIVEPAILDARKNAKHNGINNVEFMVGDAAVLMPKLYKQGVKADVVLVDPIRAGCKEEVLLAAVSMEPQKIVYVSCNPASMARDIEILTKHNYELVKVQPVDMFPQTAHVECVALLNKV